MKLSPQKILLYFAIIIVAGGIGCWISLAQYLLSECDNNYRSFIGNVATFAISMAVLTFADYLLRIDSEEAESTHALGFVLMLLLSVGLAAGSMLLPSRFIGPVALAAGVIALLKWWIVNVRNRALATVDPEDALGGPVR